MDKPLAGRELVRTAILTGEMSLSPQGVEQLLSDYVDPAFYAAENQLTEPPENPVHHYLTVGSAQGYLPNPWFNGPAYAAGCAGSLEDQCVPLLRFAVRAAVDKAEKSRVLAFTRAKHVRKLLRPYFDRQYYLERYQDVAGDPLSHYIRTGWRERRDPSAWFSTDYYIRSNGDVRGAGVNPLLHYAVFGEAEGRKPGVTGFDKIRTPDLPTKRDWDRIQPRHAPHCHVDVIVPVYKGYKDTLACLFSVLTANNKTACNLIVVNDASPERRLTAKLRALAARDLFVLLENEQNEGFVKSVTKGMSRHPANDVILLNSDTVVSGNWIDRLRYHAKSGTDVATVTPFSNNATICSYPLANRNNVSRLEIDSSQLDKLFKQTNKQKSISIPVGVGFCMWINRAAIDRVGLFDTDAFEKGYGEEVDFCLRCLKAGMRNLHALDVYVQHTGEVSFRKTASDNRRAGERAVDLKHPDFRGRVRRFVDVDPSLEARSEVDWSRFVRHFRGRCAIFVLHDMGGGIEKNARDLAVGLAREGIDVLALRVVSGTIATVRFEQFSVEREIYCPNAGELSVFQSHQKILDVLKALKPRFVHVHSVAKMHINAVDRLFSVLGKCGAKTYYTWHDYTPFCPRNSFVDAEGRYCNEDVGERCNACVAHRPPVQECGNDADRWRRVFASFLRGVHTQFLPNRDVASRAERLPRTGEMRVRPHLAGPLPNVVFDGPPPDRSPIRIATVGAIGPHKGSDVLMALATDARLRGLPVEFRVVGYTDYHGRGAVAETGEYPSDEGAVLRLMEYRPHFALLPSVCPETFSYALSLVLKLGLPPIVLDIGALAERLKSLDVGIVLPPSLADRPNAFNDRLLEVNVEAAWTRMRKAQLCGDGRSVVDYYGWSEEISQAVGMGDARKPPGVRKRHRVKFGSGFL